MRYITKSKSAYNNPDEKLSLVGCAVPFRHIEIHSWGQVSACCYTWLPTWVGNLLNESVDEVLDNLDRKRIQENMLQGRFDNCNDQCPQLNAYLNSDDRSQFQYDIVPKEKLIKIVEERPYNIFFSYDLSCNLQCPSCRKDLIVWRPDNLEDENAQRLVKIHAKVKDLVNKIVAQGHRVVLNITGSGDAFASPIYWEYLQELASMTVSKNISIIIQTNGVMMTEDKWHKIKNLWPHITYVNISVDAATEETYKIVRKNGNFTKLQTNLDYFDQMVADGLFPNLSDWQTNFIVQKDNFRELKQFVEQQLRFKSKPIVWTNLIAQWYHMSQEEHEDMAVWQDQHPMHRELVEIMQDPIFKHPQLKLGNLNALVKN